MITHYGTVERNLDNSFISAVEIELLCVMQFSLYGVSWFLEVPVLDKRMQ